MKLAVICLLFAFSGLALAGGDHHTAVPMPKEFTPLKALVGTWEGTTMMDGKETPVTAVYELTSGGTALTERLMAGTPNEMISVYHKDGKSLGMTHYCAMGNQPHMQMTHATDKQIAFEVKKPVGLTSMNEDHMHAITLTMADPDSLTQEWVNYKDGKKNGVVTFSLKRKK